MNPRVCLQPVPSPALAHLPFEALLGQVTVGRGAPLEAQLFGRFPELFCDFRPLEIAQEGRVGDVVVSGELP